jgi:hypothetical protein
MSTNDPYTTPEQPQAPQWEFQYRGELPYNREDRPQNLTGYEHRQWPTQPQPTNGLAVAALVLGIVWAFWIGSALAIVFGHVALGQIRQRNQSGKGMAVAGLVLGYVGAGTFVLFVVLPLLLGAGA